MKTSKVLRVMNSLNNQEQIQFKLFVESPFFSGNKTLINLYDLLIEIVRGKAGYSKEKIYGKLFKKEDYNDLRLRHLFSDLLKLLEKYFAYCQFDQNKVLQNVYQLRSYRNRNLGNVFKNKHDKAIRLLRESPFRNGEFYQNDFMLQSEWTDFLQDSKVRTTEPNLQQTADSLDAMFVLHKLKYVTLMLNHQNIMGVQYEYVFIDEIMGWVESNEQLDIPAISIYYHLIKMLRDMDRVEHFEAYSKLIVQNVGAFKLDEARSFFVQAINYCIKQALKGKREFVERILWYYKFMLKKGIAYENGYLSPWMYKNIVVAGMRLNDEVWVKKFINKYKNRLKPEYRENAYRYNMAKVCFGNGEFQKVITLLQTIEYNDIFYSLDSKAMLMKTYYELNEQEALRSLAKSFSIYIRRKRNLSESHKQNYLNLIVFIRKALMVRNGKQHLLPSLQSNFETTRSVSDRKWLQSKIAQL